MNKRNNMSRIMATFTGIAILGTSDHSLKFSSGDVGIERSDDAMSVFTRK